MDSNIHYNMVCFINDKHNIFIMCNILNTLMNNLQFVSNCQYVFLFNKYILYLLK